MTWRRTCSVRLALTEKSDADTEFVKALQDDEAAQAMQQRLQQLQQLYGGHILRFTGPDCYTFDEMVDSQGVCGTMNQVLLHAEMVYDVVDPLLDFFSEGVWHRIDDATRVEELIGCVIRVREA